MRTAPAALTASVLALATATAGCSFSSVKADADVHITGRALDANGKPLANTKVLLFKQADIGEVIFGTVFTLGTLGAACLVPGAPSICDKAHTATTDANGTYDFTVKGSDTQGSLGTEATLSVVFSGGAQKTSTTVSFAAKTTSVTLPDARLWAAGAHRTRRGPLSVAWSPLPGTAGTGSSYSVQLYAGTGQAPVWTQAASGSAATIDPRIQEGVNGAMTVAASATLPSGTGTGDVHASYLSARLPAPAVGHEVPISRNQPCAPVTGTAPAVTGHYTRCNATDGDLTNPARLVHQGGGVVDGVAIDLGRSRPVSLVVARGFTGQYIVEISSDGHTWSTVTTSSGTSAITVPGTPHARYVRLRSPVGLDESLSAEVSVWS